MAFIRVKRRGERRYAYLVKSVWDPDAGGPRQRVIKYLGPAEDVRPEDLPPEHRTEPAIVRWLEKHATRAQRTYDEDRTRLRGALRGALLEANGPEIERLTGEAVDRLGTWSFLDDLLLPLLRQVGEDWYNGVLNVADEHIVTRGVQNIVRRLRDEAVNGRAQALGPGLTVLLANPEGETHHLALDVLECRLAAHGHRTVVSPGGLPRRDLSIRARQLGPDVVLLSATLAPSAGESVRAAEAVLDRSPASLVALGGQAWERVDAPESLDARVRILPGPAGESLDALLEDATARRHARTEQAG